MNAKKFLAFALALCLVLPFSACRNDDDVPSDIPTIETHAGAINPDSVIGAEVVHYDDNGAEKFRGTLEKGSPYLPLIATVYDKEAETTPTGEARILKFTVIMTLDNKKTIELAVYSDLTMDMGKVTLTAQETTQFLYSLIMTASFTTAETGA